MIRLLHLLPIVVTCLNTIRPCQAEAEVCTVGKKPPAFGDGWSTTKGLFLNIHNPITCNGTVTLWKFCYYIDPDVSPTDKAHVELYFGLWQRKNESNKDVYRHINGSQWNPSTSVLDSSFDFICERWSLSEGQQFDVDLDGGVVVGVYIPTGELTHRVHVVGMSNSSTVWLYTGNETELDQDLDAASLSKVDGYGLYLEAEIGIALSPNSTPSTTTPSRNLEEVDSDLPLWALFIFSAMVGAVLTLVVILGVILCKFRTAARKRKYKVHLVREPQENITLELQRRNQAVTKPSTDHPTTMESGFRFVPAQHHSSTSPHQEQDYSILTPHEAHTPNSEMGTTPKVTLSRPGETVFFQSHMAVPVQQLKKSKSENDIIRSKLIPSVSDQGQSVLLAPNFHENAPRRQLSGRSQSSGATGFPEDTETDELYAIPSNPYDLEHSHESDPAYSYPYMSHTLPKKVHSSTNERAQKTSIVPPRDVFRKHHSFSIVTPSAQPNETGRRQIKERAAEFKPKVQPKPSVMETAAQPSLNFNPVAAGGGRHADPDQLSINSASTEDGYINDDEYPVNSFGARQMQSPLEGVRVSDNDQYASLLATTREEQTVYEDPQVM